MSLQKIQIQWKRLAIAVAVMVATAGYFAYPRIKLAMSGQSVQLTDIGDISELRTRFNQDAGSPRLVLIVSPT